MAITDTTLTLINGMNVSALAPVDQAAQALIQGWGVAWNELAPEWEAAIADLTTAGRNGHWPSAAKVARAKRVMNAMNVTREALQQLATELPILVSEQVPAMVGDAAVWARRITASQYPAEAGSAAQVADAFSKVNPETINAIVRRTTTRVTSLSRPLSGQAERAVRASLIRGVALGENPRKAAATMLDRVNGDFNGGRNRALVIARTEMLDAHRAGGAAQDKAMADNLRGWQWVAQLDRRTCPSCWSQHGGIFDLDVPGPEDHQQGRCARVPVAKSWRDLGFDLDEPASLLPDAQATFARLPREQQLQVMGKQRLDLLDSGQASWSDLSTKRTTDGWRDSWAPAPVKDLLAKAA